MDKKVSVGLHNRFDLVVRDAKSNRVKRTARAENIILDQFWSAYFSFSREDIAGYIQFGSGTVEPSPADTALTAYLGYKSPSSSSYDYSTTPTDGIMKRYVAVRIEDTEQIGATIGEVGFAYGTSQSTLVTKALCRDQNGNPITITKGEGEVIDIFGTFYFKLPFSSDWYYTNNAPDWKEYISIFSWLTTEERSASSNYYVEIELCSSFREQNFPQNFVTYGLGKLTSISMNSGMQDHMVFDVANKTAAIHLGFNAGEANVGGIRMLSLGGNIHIRLPLEGFTQPVIEKEVVGTGDGTNTQFQSNFGRIRNNGTAQLYVNDVPVSATFTYGGLPPSCEYAEKLVVVEVFETSPEFPYGRVTFENPTEAAVLTAYGASFEAYASDDMASWVQVASHSGSYKSEQDISVDNQRYRYYRVIGTNEYFAKESMYLGLSRPDTYDIACDTPPAAGATVSLTYQPDCIAKDDQHVIRDMTITFSFNEYTP